MTLQDKYAPAHHVLTIAQDWLAQGRRLALATVIQTWGSAPRPVGSPLLIDQAGNFEGSVSGGCVEGAVIIEALETIETSKATLLEFGVDNETAWQVGLTCGGKISIRVEPVFETNLPQIIEDLNTARAQRKPAILLTNLEENTHTLVSSPESVTSPLLQKEITQRFHSGKSGLVSIKDGQSVFLTVQIPSPRLIVVGAVHIAQALVPMAQSTGFDVSVIDPRSAFATKERFPQVALYDQWPQDVLEEIKLDPYTAVALLTHDPKIDDTPLMEALNTGCFYVGALGSKKTHASRRERLAKAGIPEPLIDRISAPIGLNIGAATPAEIAVSILSQIIAFLRNPQPHVFQGDQT
ncbi:XdhC family protein [Flexibacterium corallicola]|uniref:XdhC family protein n=1 Tax=Flexibacterium corallicola TaxID=3037259 RepID=UPI00286F0A61|nr:XdhC family protein [Pseudovibrio sp. M1P-2-3]